MKTTVNPVPTNTVYALDDESFKYTSVSSVLQELASAGNLNVGVAFYAAESVPCRAETYFNVTDILEQADVRAYEEVGEIDSNVFTRTSPQAREELKAMLSAWAEKHVVVDYWRIVVGNSWAVTVTAQDLQAYQESLDAALTVLADGQAKVGAGNPFPHPLGPERARTCEALADVVRDYRNEFRRALPLTNQQPV